MNTSTPHILIVDDEADIRELVEITLGRMGLKTRAAANLELARQFLKNEDFDLCLTDMRLPDGDGINLVLEIQRNQPQLPVAVITAYGSTQTAVDSLKAGAFDFVTKPLEVATLRKLVNDALKLGTAQGTPGQPLLLGDSPVMVKLRHMIERVARSQAPVHVSGESGTGKELVARSIHAQGPRSAAAFVPVNCGAIPNELMESELFGHVRGSFTGAVTDNEGLFRKAEGGTLFLDEVAELPLHMQVKLLRALQERHVRAVGASQETPVDVRIISATHADLGARTVDGRFRQDLYYRLNVIEIRTPPLREHPQDIPQLAEVLLQRISARTGSKAPELAPDTLSALSAHPFPGNVRELENILERAFALCNGTRILEQDLALRPAKTDVQTQPDEQPPEPEPAEQPHRPLDEQIAGMQRRAIMDALEKTRWNRSRAAKLLGMSFRQLRYRLKKLDIE